MSEDDYHKLLLQLDRIDILTCRMRDEFSFLTKANTLTSLKKEEMINDILNIVLYLGDLTLPLFAQRDSLERAAFKLIDNPVEARKQWLKIYSNKHRPFDKQKRRVHHLLTVVEDYEI